MRELQIYDARERAMVRAADLATAPLRWLPARVVSHPPGRILLLRLERIGVVAVELDAAETHSLELEREAARVARFSERGGRAALRSPQRHRALAFARELEPVRRPVGAQLEGPGRPAVDLDGDAARLVESDRAPTDDVQQLCVVICRDHVTVQLRDLLGSIGVSRRLVHRIPERVVARVLSDRGDGLAERLGEGFGASGGGLLHRFRFGVGLDPPSARARRRSIRKSRERLSSIAIGRINLLYNRLRVGFTAHPLMQVGGPPRAM